MIPEGKIAALLFLTLPLAAGFLLDLIVGDPSWMPHPIRLMGKAIEKGEGLIRSFFPKSRGGELLGGAALAVLLMALSFLIPLGILYGAAGIHPVLALTVETVMCYQILAVKSLKTESMKVYDALEPLPGSVGETSFEEGGMAGCDLEKARRQVSMIVGRDTKELTAEQVARAAIETVAENTADGGVAPMLFLALGGAPLGFLYKAVNTMDSMIGYKNDRYLYFGRTAARLDDLLNFVPARISAVLMIMGAFLLRMDYRNAGRIFLRDRFNHASPNSAQTESVCAGALDVQLAGDAYYFGKLLPKKTIGDALRPVERQDILRANRLLYAAAWLCLIMCLLGMGAVVWLS